MAVDESLLELVCQGGQTGFLRFYRWQQPTLSLGYFQRHADRHDHPPSRNCPMVRRATGGGAIVHAHELTYSLCIPLNSHWDKRSRTLYRVVHEALIEEFGSRGIQAKICGENSPRPLDKEPFLCFLRRTDADILLAEHKIAGSAQRRRGLGLLQHGSVLLRVAHESPELAGIEDISGVCVDPSELARCWSQRIAARLQWRLQLADLGEDLSGLARRWAETRFGREEWICKR
jgi:lipoyl(octanoyl) transferase